MHAFEDFITKMSDALGSHLDKNKVSGMIAESVSPVLFNKKFIKRIDSLIGFLEEQDLVVLFSALGKEAPELEAKNFLRFMSILRKQDKESLALEFLTLPKDSTQLEFDQLAVKKMLDNIHALIEQVLDCHCYYNGQDRKGSEGTSNRPKLLERLSPDLADITIEVDRGSFFSNFSRKGFYIHAITRGLAAGGKVSADANQHIVKALERVKTHILRPLWWGTNVSNLSYNFIKACRDLAHAFVAAWYGLVNGSKSTLNWMTGRTYFKISEKHPDSEDFNETAFDFSSTVNELEPLGAEQVTEKECPVDAVTHLEDFITRRPARPGFFGGTLGKVDDGHEEPSHSPKV